MAKKISRTGPAPIDERGAVERVTISLTPSILERVDKLAQENGQSRSYIIRRSLEENLPSMERMAQALTDPFWGGIRRRFMSMIAEAEKDPTRAKEIAEVLNNFEQKSQQKKKIRRKKASSDG